MLHRPLETIPKALVSRMQRRAMGYIDGPGQFLLTVQKAGFAQAFSAITVYEDPKDVTFTVNKQCSARLSWSPSC